MKPSAHPGRDRSLVAHLARFVTRSPIHICLLLIGAVWLVPTVGLLITSVRPGEDIFASGWWTAFGQLRFTSENYVRVITSRGTTDSLAKNFMNSLIITVPSTVLPVLLASVTAYALAWIDFPGRDWLLLTIVALLVIPIQMTFVPILRLYNSIGLTISFVGIWIAHTAYGLPFAVYLLHNFFVGLPRDLLESAKIDGASELSILGRIVLPLSVPALASLVIFQFLWVWNDLLVAMIYLQHPRLMPLTIGINTMLSAYGPEWDLLSAGAFVTMVVPLLIFLALQRYFVRGLIAGAVKA